MSIQRDYKSAPTWQRRQQTVRRHGLLVLTLVLISLFGGALAYIKDDQSAPATAHAATAAPTAKDSTAKSMPPAIPAHTATPAAKPVIEVPPPPVKPKYDFYSLGDPHSKSERPATQREDTKSSAAVGEKPKTADLANSARHSLQQDAKKNRTQSPADKRTVGADKSGKSAPGNTRSRSALAAKPPLGQDATKALAGKSTRNLKPTDKTAKAATPNDKTAKRDRQDKTGDVSGKTGNRPRSGQPALSSNAPSAKSATTGTRAPTDAKKPAKPTAAQPSPPTRTRSAQPSAPLSARPAVVIKTE